ncbi:hypothetical protein [Macrococcus animalis]|uniref:hypothetical protein n=1 Tax=Macrococcus animalis TaxID=3395467 RepID=UPI0039BEB9E5
MNNKLFFYIYLFLVAFLSINVYKHITNDAPASDYLIYAIIALTFLGLITDDLIQLFYGKKSPITSTIVNIFIYISIIILSFIAIKASSAMFDIILYCLFIPLSILLIYVQLMVYRKENKPQ